MVYVMTYCRCLLILDLLLAKCAQILMDLFLCIDVSLLHMNMTSPQILLSAVDVIIRRNMEYDFKFEYLLVWTIVMYPDFTHILKALFFPS